MTTSGQGPGVGPRTSIRFSNRSVAASWSPGASDGSPTTHPLTPLWADGAIHFNTYRKSAKVRNLLRHPRVACVVTSADDDPSYFAVECRGTAEVLDLADIPDSILGVDDNGEVMEASDLERVPPERRLGEAHLSADGPRGVDGVRAPGAERRRPAGCSWHPTRMPSQALVPSHIAMTAEEADGIPAPEAGRRSGHGRRRGHPQRTTGPLHRRAAASCT